MIRARYSDWSNARLNERLAALALTSEQFGLLLGYGPRTIRNWRRDQPFPPWVELVVEYLDRKPWTTISRLLKRPGGEYAMVRGEDFWKALYAMDVSLRRFSDIAGVPLDQVERFRRYDRLPRWVDHLLAYLQENPRLREGPLLGKPGRPRKTQAELKPFATAYQTPDGHWVWSPSTEDGVVMAPTDLRALWRTRTKAIAAARLAGYRVVPLLPGSATTAVQRLPAAPAKAVICPHCGRTLNARGQHSHIRACRERSELQSASGS